MAPIGAYYLYGNTVYLQDRSADMEAALLKKKEEDDILDMSSKKFLPMITDKEVEQTSEELGMPADKAITAKLKAQREYDNITRVSAMKRELVDLEEAKLKKDLIKRTGKDDI